MNRKEEYKTFLWILGFFLFAYFMPLTNPVFKEALLSAFELIKWYAQEHVLLCLVPAFFIAGVIAVFVGQEAVIKYFGANAKKWLSYLVASVSGTIFANFFASIIGAFMYFATLTEVPILQGLITNGMGKGPALSLLLAGPALSLPNMLVIRGVIGTQKTVVYVTLVVIMATASGFIYGAFF